MAIFKTRSEDLETIEAEPKAPAHQVDVAPPEKQHAELEVCSPPELSPPPAVPPASAVEPGPASDKTEAPPLMDEEPSLEPMEAPALEEELPLEGPAQGPEAPAQEVDVVPITSDEQHEEQDAEPEVCPPPELSPPPSAAPDGAEETGPAPDATEALKLLDEEPSLEPMQIPALEEELPVEGPAQGPLFQCVRPVQHGTKGKHMHLQHERQCTGLYMPEMPHHPDQASGLVGTSPGDKVRHQRPQQMPWGGRGKPLLWENSVQDLAKPHRAQLHCQGSS
uniref:Uncharacterized protein n=1 Tax=Myotis myotis TaxID=51298 RepID=A0A7J7UPY1_MYOMY|nr:hypothetical protein mMyoMyo1_008693 [Myotis myotis]